MNKSARSTASLLFAGAPQSTIALESQVKDVLSTAKAKLTDLSRDIDRLNKDNEHLQRQVDYAEQHKAELSER